MYHLFRVQIVQNSNKDLFICGSNSIFNEYSNNMERMMQMIYAIKYSLFILFIISEMKKGLTLQYLKGITVPAVRGKAKKCLLCDKEFGFITKEHQCKRCKRAVCDKCSPNKAHMIKKQQLSKQPHRQCNVCKEESDFMKKFIDQEKLIFMKDTLSLGWLTSFGYTQETAKKEYDQARYDLQQQNQKDQSEYNRMQKEIEEIFAELVQCYNYSLKEFFYYLLKDFEPNMINTTIQKILGTFLLNYPEVGYSPDQAFILLYLLSFSSEASAYTLLTLIYAQMIPTQTYPSNQKATKYDYAYEIDKVISILESGYKLQNQDKPIVRSFLNATLDKYLQTFTLNFFLQESTHFIIDQMFKNPKQCYDDLLKSLASTFSNRIDDMKRNPQNHDETELLILRSTKKAIIQTGYLNTIHLSVQIPQQKNIPRKSAILQKQKTIIQDSPFQQVQRSDSIENNDLFKQVQSDNERLQIEISNLEKSLDQLRIRLKEQQTTIEEQAEQLQQYQDLQNNNVINQDEMSEIQQEIQNYAKNNQEFLDLRRETMQLAQKSGNKLELSKLKQYIDKLEHSLMMEHKISNELKQTIENLRGNNDTKQSHQHQHDSGDHEEDDGESKNQPSMLQLMMSKNQQLREQVEKLQEQVQNQGNSKANEEFEQNNLILEQKISDIKKELQQLKTEKQQQEDLMFQEIDSLTQENNNLKQQETSQKDLIIQLTQQKDQLQLKLDEAKQIESERNMLLLSLEEMQKTFNENKQLKNQVEAAKKGEIEKNQLAEKHQNLNNQFQKLQQEYNQIQTKNQQQVKELEKLALEMIIFEKLKLEIKESKNKQVEYEKLLNEKDLTIYNLQEQIRIDKERQEFLMDQDNDDEEKLQNLQKELDENRQQLLAFKQQTIINQDVKRKQIEELSNQNESLNLQLEEAKSQILSNQSKFDQEIQELQNTIKDIQDKNHQIQSQYEQQVAQLKTNIIDLTEKNQQITEEMKLRLVQSEETQQKLENQLKNQLESHKIIVNELEMKISFILEEQTQQKQMIVSLTTQIENLNQALAVKQEEISYLMQQNEQSKRIFNSELEKLQQEKEILNKQLHEDKLQNTYELEKSSNELNQIQQLYQQINEQLELKIVQLELLMTEKTQQDLLLVQKIQTIEELQKVIAQSQEDYNLNNLEHEKQKNILNLQLQQIQEEQQTYLYDLNQKNDQIALLKQQLVRIEQSLNSESSDLNQKLKDNEEIILQMKHQQRQYEQNQMIQEELIASKDLQIQELEQKNHEFSSKYDKLLIEQQEKAELSLIIIAELNDKHNKHIQQIQNENQQEIQLLKDQIQQLNEASIFQQTKIESQQVMLEEQKQQEQKIIEQGLIHLEEQKEKLNLQIQQLESKNNELQIQYERLVIDHDQKLNEQLQIQADLREEYNNNIKILNEDHQIELENLQTKISQSNDEFVLNQTEMEQLRLNLQEQQKQNSDIELSKAALEQIITTKDSQIQDLSNIIKDLNQKCDSHEIEKVHKVEELELIIVALNFEHKNKINKLEAEFQVEIKNYQNQILQLQQQNEEQNNIIFSLRDKMDEMNQDKENMKHFYYEKIENLESQVNNLEYFQSQNETAKFELEQQNDSQRQKISDLTSDLLNIINQRDELQIQLKESQILIENQVNDYKGQINDLIKEKEQAISSYSSQIMELENKMQKDKILNEGQIIDMQNQFESQLLQIEQFNEEKQKLEQQYFEQKDQNNLNQDLIESLKAQILQLQELVETKSQEIANLSISLTTHKDLTHNQQNKIGQFEVQLIEFQDQIDERHKYTQNLDQTNRDLSEKLTELNKIQEMYYELSIKFDQIGIQQNERIQEMQRLTDLNNQLNQKYIELEQQCQQLQQDKEFSQESLEQIQLSNQEQCQLINQQINEIKLLQDQGLEYQNKSNKFEECNIELNEQIEQLQTQLIHHKFLIEQEKENYNSSLQSQIIRGQEQQQLLEQITLVKEEQVEINRNLLLKIEEYSNKIMGLNQQISELDNTVITKQSELEQIKHFIQVCEQKVFIAEEQLQQFINSQGDDIGNLMNQVQVKDQEIQDLKTLIQQLNQQQEDKELQIQQSNQMIQNKEQQISILSQTQESNNEIIDNKKKKIKTYQKQLKYYEAQSQVQTQSIHDFEQQFSKNQYHKLLNQSINNIYIMNFQNQTNQDQKEIQQLLRDQIAQSSKIRELHQQVDALQLERQDIVLSNMKVQQQLHQQQKMTELLQDDKLYKEQTEMEIQLMAKQQMNHYLKQQIDQRDYQILELQDKQVESSAWYEEQLDLKNTDIQMLNQEVEQLVNRINNYKILKDLVIKYFQINQEVIENLQFDVIEQIFNIYKKESSQLLVQKEEASKLQQQNKLLEIQVNNLQQELQNLSQQNPYLSILNDDKEKEMDSEQEEQLNDILFELFEVEDKTELLNKCRLIQEQSSSTYKSIMNSVQQQENNIQELQYLFQGPIIGSELLFFLHLVQLNTKIYIKRL
ncbi:hypothetical protein pb186bvf_008131 [Paramecium bursaria]